VAIKMLASSRKGEGCVEIWVGEKAKGRRGKLLEAVAALFLKKTMSRLRRGSALRPYQGA